ncbi:MAG: methyltransferase domain-containing protein [Candidatus Omnitrophica bacterium]|nr:methyltransferase domain-containing protein [Candidatus Omnitrophota bacterium]
MGKSTTVQEIEHGRWIAHKAEEVWGWQSPAGRLRASRRKTLLRDHGRFVQGHRVLEIGCGTGVFTEALVGSGAEVIAMDISLELLSKAREKWPDNPLKCFVADAAHLPLPSHCVDVVLGVSVLHHLNLATALPEFARVIKKGGRIVFSEPNMLNPQIFFQKNIPFLKRWLGDTPSETAFVRWWLRRILRQASFSEVQAIPFDFLHPATPASFIPAVRRLGAFLESAPILREIAGSLLITACKV